MKKYLILLLCAYGMQAQTLQNPTFGTVKTMTAPTVTTTPHLGTVETNGVISKITPANLPVSTATQIAIDGKVSDTIRDGINAIAPSENAVFDALATKLDGTSLKTIEGQSIVGTGNIDITKANVGLGNVDNTSDLNKPISTATQTALNGKQNTISGIPNRVFPKSNGSGGFVTSNLSDDGLTVQTSTDLSVFGLRIGRGGGANSSNTAFGLSAFLNNTTGFNNSVFGSGAGANISSSQATTLFGNISGTSLTGGIANSFFGQASGTSLNTGSFNTLLGYRAGQLTSGAISLTSLSNSVLIGSQSYPLANGDTNEIVIAGSNGLGLGSNTNVIGNTSTSQTWLGGMLTVGSQVNDGINSGQFTGGLKTDILRISTTPTTSAGAYRLLSYNETSDEVESIPSNTYATTASLTDANIQNGVITTSTSITNATLTDTSKAQNGKTILIANGANNINYTVNGDTTASFIKGGTGTITFVQGSVRTMVAANGTLVLNGAQYSTASIVSFGTTDIVYINNL